MQSVAIGAPRKPRPLQPSPPCSVWGQRERGGGERARARERGRERESKEESARGRGKEKERERERRKERDRAVQRVAIGAPRKPSPLHPSPPCTNRIVKRVYVTRNLFCNIAFDGAISATVRHPPI